MSKIRNCKKCGKFFTTSIKHKVWCPDCYDEVHKEVKCVICGTTFKQKYQNEQTCSKKCAATLRGNFKNPIILSKIAATNIKNLGYANPWDSKEVQLKCAQNKKAINKNNLSKPAKLILDVLKNDGIHSNITTEKLFDGCVFKSKLPFDFCVEEDDGSFFLIEYDGEQHKNPVAFSNSTDKYKMFIHTQITDWLKDKYCIENNINLLRIPSIGKETKNFKELKEFSYIVGKSQRYDKKLDCFGIIQEDFVNSGDCTFTIESGISCTFKCCKECSTAICQNSEILNQNLLHLDIDSVINMYKNNDLPTSISFQGLEPLDNLKQLLWFIYYFRKESNDRLIIWTGYTEQECEDFIYLINKMNWKNIIMKFGRFIPGDIPHYDTILGVNLVSSNQYGKEINK